MSGSVNVRMRVTSLRAAIALSLLLHGLVFSFLRFSITPEPKKKIEIEVTLSNESQVVPINNLEPIPEKPAAPALKKKIDKNHSSHAPDFAEPRKLLPKLSDLPVSKNDVPEAQTSNLDKPELNATTQAQIEPKVKNQTTQPQLPRIDKRERDDYGDILAKHISKFKYYPKYALMHRIQGNVVVELQIDERGVLVASRVSRGSGSDMLDVEALNMVRKALPLPAPIGSLKGKAFSMYVPIEFLLD